MQADSEKQSQTHSSAHRPCRGVPRQPRRRLCCRYGDGIYRPRTASASDEPAQFSVFWEVWNLVDQYFVDQDKIDPTKMTYGAIQGMLATLGDENHTVFFSPEEAKQQAEVDGGLV